MATLLKGKPVAEAIDANIAERLPALYDKGIVPTLAIVRVGENPSDIAYENGAIKRAQKLGLQAEKYICEEKIEESDLLAVIESINENEQIHGILLLQPLPEHLNSQRIRNAIATEKDLDCISDGALGRFFATKEGFAPCTAESCIEILRHYGIERQGKRAVVIGRSMVIGKPVALMLMNENATVTVCHTKTKQTDLQNLCRKADVIVAAAGHAKTFTADMAAENQVVLDVGINFDEEGKMIGDVDFAPVCDVAGAVTPVPGGVGSVTTSLLLRHLVEAAEKNLR